MENNETMRHTKKQAKQFIADKFIKNWIKDNKEFLDDYEELCKKLIMFRLVWGVEIGIIFKNSEEVKGRELGAGKVEELFNVKK